MGKFSILVVFHYVRLKGIASTIVHIVENVPFHMYENLKIIKCSTFKIFSF